MARVFVFALVAIVGCTSAASRGFAQYDEQPRVRLTPVDLKGKVEEVGNGFLKVQCSDKLIYVKVDPQRTKVQCTGTADRKFIKPGLLVRFTAEIDKRGTVQDDIESLAIVTPSETAQPGIHSDIPTFGEEEPQGRRKPKAEQPKNEPGSFVVVGTVKLFKDDQLQVVAGGKQIKAQLTADAEIKVDVDDYTFAQAGDEIAFRGLMAPMGMNDEFGQAIGTDLVITFAKPLEPTAGKKKPAKGDKGRPEKPAKPASAPKRGAK